MITTLELSPRCNSCQPRRKTGEAGKCDGWSMAESATWRAGPYFWRPISHHRARFAWLM